MINEDFYWHIQIIATDNITEIKRQYFTILQVFSGIGGTFPLLLMFVSTF